ncbi:MAG: UDP-3-O-(3-hydroxymyristoyl)glucosamine N-acyltransferase [Verrucomicrobiales bacterium]|nr:UDP-3-O-(3-hydroxymyristoyl)glucosamine N-acyltransferase [Verrucomicrobiales bacterium]
MEDKSLTVEELVAQVGGKLLQGDGMTRLCGLNSLRDAEPGEVSFLGNASYLAQLETSRASAVLVAADFSGAAEGKALIGVENPTLAFSKVVEWFGVPDVLPPKGVHPRAMVGEGVEFDATKVSVAAGAFIGDGVQLGDGCVIHSGARIGAGARLGKDCVLHENAVVKQGCVLGNRVVIHSNSVIGSDGFGYQQVEGRHVKIPQKGIVQIDDDVEIGSCTTIDRARFGKTWIQEGTKIDNLVQIAHNCVIGRHCILVSQVGISGSTRLGDYVTMGGQVGVAGHLEIAGRSLILAKSGVTKSVTVPGAYTGFPAKPLMEGRKLLAYPGKVPDLQRRVKALEAKLAELEK